MNIDLERKKIELKRVEMSRFEMEFRIKEMQAEILKLEGLLEVQKKREHELTKEIGESTRGGL